MLLNFSLFLQVWNWQVLLNIGAFHYGAEDEMVFRLAMKRLLLTLGLLLACAGKWSASGSYIALAVQCLLMGVDVTQAYTLSEPLMSLQIFRCQYVYAVCLRLLVTTTCCL